MADVLKHTEPAQSPLQDVIAAVQCALAKLPHNQPHAIGGIVAAAKHQEGSAVRASRVVRFQTHQTRTRLHRICDCCQRLTPTSIHIYKVAHAQCILQCTCSTRGCCSLECLVQRWLLACVFLVSQVNSRAIMAPEDPNKHAQASQMLGKVAEHLPAAATMRLLKRSASDQPHAQLYLIVDC
jgi:hypothetical protein